MKKIAGILICIALAFTFAACSWEIPEKVSVKTNADYNFALGNIEKDFSSELNVSKMIGDLELPNNGKVYDYWPDKKGNTQKYLMYMPLQEIPVDIGKYFNEGMLNDLENKPIIDQTIKVPSISIPEIKVDNIGFETLSDKLNEIFKLSGPSVTMPLNNNIQLLLNSLGRSFESITYKSGMLVIESDLTDGIQVWIESNGHSTERAVFIDGKANVDIAGFVINTNDLTIHFSEDNLSKIFETHLSDNAEIKSVSGLTMNYDFEMPLSMNFDSVKQSLNDSNIKQCIIGEGSSLQVKFNIPWDGVTSNYSFKFEGGIDFSSGKYSSQNETSEIPLTNAIITPNDINSKVNFELTFEDAVIDFDKKSSISASASIKKIASATVGLPNLDIPPAFEQDIPDNVKNVVDEIIINDCGVTVDYVNDFSKDNDITLNVSSNFFAIENETGTIKGGQSDSFSLLSSSDAKTRNLNTYDKFDFTVNVTLPGGKSKEITVTDLDMNKDYHLKLSVKPVINWTKVTLKLSSDLFGDEGTGVIGTNFNPSSVFTSLDDVMGKDFSKSIKLPNCKMYLYFTCPESLKEMFDPNNEGLSGSSIGLYYGDTNKNPITATSSGTQITDNEEISILDSTDSLHFTSKPVFIYEEGTETVTSQLSESESSLCKSLADVFKLSDASKEEGAQLCVKYNLSLGAENATKEIKRTDLSDTEVGSIGIYAIIELPLSFKVTGNTEIDLKKIMNKDDEESEDKDLFSRDNADGMEDVEKYLEAIESAKLDFRLDAFPITSTKDIEAEIVLSDNNSSVYEQKINLSMSGNNSFEIRRDEISDILNAYPLKLGSAKITIPENNEISIPRTKKIDVNLQIGLKTDGTIELFGDKN